MIRTYTKFLTTLLVALFAFTGAIAQESGDFRSAADGNWSATATWEMYDGSDWAAATAAPDGSENITIQAANSVSVDAAVTVSGTVTVEGSDPGAGGSLAVSGGSLTIADGGTYVHARDAGAVPMATWQAGSTIEFTGIMGDEPDNVDQSFHHVVWNNSGQVSNISLGWNDYTLAGNLTVLNSNGSQFRLSSAGDEGDPARSITINGNVVVDGENSEFTSTGSGDVFNYNIEVLGDIEVTNGGFLSVSRGSGGAAVWTLHGDLTVTDGRVGESNIDKHGQRRSFVFAGSEAQTITGSNVETESTLYYEIAAGSDVTVAAGDFPVDSLTVQGSLTLEGNLEASGPVVLDGGTMTVADGGTYTHNYDGGDIPEASWEIGSTVALTGIQGSNPGNRDQDFYNFTWNNEGQVSNLNLGWDSYILRGNLTVLNTNGNQFRLTSANTDAPRVINIQGDVIVDGENSEFTTTGSGDVAEYDITVEGDVSVINGGFLSVSRGSGGAAVWTLHGDLTVTDGRVGESNIDKHGQRRSFVFAGSEAQTITGSNVETESTLYYEIASGSDVTVASGSFPMDSLTVQGSLTLSGELEANGPVVVDGGSITVADGGTYNHAHDAGEVPNATWETGSTIAFTGILADEPDNVEQDFYNVVWNNAEQVSNISLGWNDYTLAGNLTVLNSNGSQFRLSSAGDEGDPARSITINGNIVVDGENSEFTSTGSGDIFDYNITVWGDIEVTNDGFLSASRGSGGRAVWTLYGDLTVNSGRLGESDIDKHGQERTFVFAADTVDGGSTITANDVSYDGDVYFEIADSAGVTLAEGSDFLVEGYVTNYGSFDVDDGATLRFSGDEAVYVHAQDGGSVPMATWEEGSTALFNSIVTSGPDNASQDFYNLVIDSPNNVSNNDFGMRGNTIQGDIDIVSTGDARIYFTQPDAFDTLTINVMGDIHMQSGAFSTNGTGNGASEITINHYGDITVDDGNFSISRGSGPMVFWYLHEGSFTFNAGVTQNSNPRSGSGFIFSGEDTVQTLSVTEDVDLANLPFMVDSLATLDIGDSDFVGMSSIIEVWAGGNLATSHELGFDDNLDAQILSLSSEAGYILNGDVAQGTGFRLPLMVASLTIDNEAGVVQSRGITITESLVLANGVFDNTLGFTLGEEAEVIYENGSLLIPIEEPEPLPIPEPPFDVGDNLSYNGSFAESDLGEAEADAWTISTTEGSTAEVVDDAQDGDERALALDVSWNGSANWYETEAVNEPLNVVEGETYEFSVYLKADAEGRIARPYIGLPESGGYARRPDFNTPEVELTTEYTRWSMEWTANAEDEENTMRFGVEVNAEVNDGATIFIDSLAVTKIVTVSNEIPDETPTEFALNQNYPNPFNPTTTISYDVPEASDVTLKVFDITGREVAELVNSRKSAGIYTIDWNAEQFATGVYLYRIIAGDFTAVRKLTLIK